MFFIPLWLSDRKFQWCSYQLCNARNLLSAGFQHEIRINGVEKLIRRQSYFYVLAIYLRKNVNKLDWKRSKVFKYFNCGRWCSDQRAIVFCLEPWISYRFCDYFIVMYLLRITLKNEGKIFELEPNVLFLQQKINICTISDG